MFSDANVQNFASSSEDLDPATLNIRSQSAAEFVFEPSGEGLLAMNQHVTLNQNREGADSQPSGIRYQFAGRLISDCGRSLRQSTIPTAQMVGAKRNLKAEMQQSASSLGADHSLTMRSQWRTDTAPSIRGGSFLAPAHG